MKSGMKMNVVECTLFCAEGGEDDGALCSGFKRVQLFRVGGK